jgi:poly-beta-1,6-N-acetyl-D-glucosamine synthase
MIALLFWLCVGGVFYAYVGYPLVLTALASLRKRPGGSYPPHTPGVTLVIAAYNEQEVIAAKLENSMASGYPLGLLQIIVAADGSDDGTAGIVESFADRGVELSYSPERKGKSDAINRAMGRATGEIVVFSDANNLYEPQTLSKLVAPFSDPSVGAVSGAKVIRSGDGRLGEAEGIYWKYESFIKRQETRLGCCTAVAGEVLAVRRELVEPIPASVINDDFYLAMRVLRRGFGIVYEPGARSTERVSPTPRDESLRRARIVAGRYQAMLMAPWCLPWGRPVIVWQVLSHKFARPLVPLCMAGALAANLVAVVNPVPAGGYALWRLAMPYNWLMLGAQTLFYLTAMLGRYVKGPSGVRRLAYIPTYLVNSNVAAVIGLFRFVTGRQSPLWRRVRRREGL